MIEVNLIFQVRDAVELFRSAGLVVEEAPMVFPFKTGGAEYKATLDVWTVINPNTGERELLEKHFRKYLQIKKSELFLSEDNKLKIINLFDKLK